MCKTKWAHIKCRTSMKFYESSTLKCNCGSKRLKKEKRDVKMAFSGIKKYENDIQSHLRRRS